MSNPDFAARADVPDYPTDAPEPTQIYRALAHALGFRPEFKTPHLQADKDLWIYPRVFGLTLGALPDFTRIEKIDIYARPWLAVRNLYWRIETHHYDLAINWAYILDWDDKVIAEAVTGLSPSFTLALALIDAAIQSTP